jgi:hypothetical protein
MCSEICVFLLCFVSLIFPVDQFYFLYIDLKTLVHFVYFIILFHPIFNFSFVLFCFFILVSSLMQSPFNNGAFVAPRNHVFVLRNRFAGMKERK